ncbi:hypothetical protein [Streptomyces sp. NPDC059909]|uniref:hypothetical protein n=1 Tax=Streptomyces sp. NPDC059909 TaxID=3346998 RepID=UPI0036655BED
MPGAASRSAQGGPSRPETGTVAVGAPRSSKASRARVPRSSSSVTATTTGATETTAASGVTFAVGLVQACATGGPGGHLGRVPDLARAARR